MAASTQKLVVELEAKVSKYQQDITKAERVLTRLQSAASKSGKEQSRLANRISGVQRRLKGLKADAKLASIELDRVGGASRRASKGSGLAGQSILNLTRGINDAKFGFAGLANNLEFVVESFGMLVKKSGGVKGAMISLGKTLIGPLGIVAGISLLIGYGPEIIKFFKNAFGGKSLKEVQASKEEVAKLNEKLKETKSFLEKINLQAAIAASEEGAAIAERDSLLGLAARNKARGKTFSGGRAAGNENLQAKDAARLAELNGIIAAKNLEKITNQELLDSENKKIGKAKDLLRAAEVQLDLMQKRGDGEEAIIRQKLYINSLEATLAEDAQDVNDVYKERLMLLNSLGLVPDRPKNLTTASSITPTGLQKLGTKSPSAALPGAGTLETIQKRNQEEGKYFDEAEYNQIMQANTALAGSFTDLGNTISNSLSNSGNIFSTFVGAAVQGLSKYITAHIAANAKVIALKKASASADAIKSATEAASSVPGVGAFILPALIASALAVVGGAFSKIGGGGSSGGGGGSISGSVARQPIRVGTRTDTGNNSLVGEVKIKGQDLVLALENANYSRRGYLPG